MSLKEFKVGEKIITFKKPLEFQSFFDAKVGYYRIENEKLNVHVYAKKLKDLRREIAEEVQMLLREYALEKDEVLTEDAKEVKQAWLKLIDIKDEKEGGGE